MALTNVLGNTYTVIETFWINRIHKSAMIQVSTFIDSNKEIKLSNFNIDIDGSGEHPEVISILSSPPDISQERDAYLVGENPSGVWSDKEGKVVCFNGLTWDEIPHVSIKLTSVNKIYLKSGSGYLPAETLLTPEEFESWFGISAIQGDSNLIQQGYEYLKTLSTFAGATNI